MRRAIFLMVLLAAVLGPAARNQTQSPPAATVIEVDAGRVRHPIPRGIYGTFLEPIGRSIYGGLWAQVLENPSFEENLWSAANVQRKLLQQPELAESSRLGLPLPWQPLDASQGWRYEPRWGDAANSRRSLLIMALPGKQTGVRQEVYLPVHRTLRYTGSFHARPISGPRAVEVSLRRRNRPEEVVARAGVSLAGGEWKRYEFALDLPPGKLARREAADFALAVSDDARVLVDQALLFPADHFEGLDPDMVALSSALKTPLVRFGGNFTSGYHWRDGVGPMDQRPSLLNQAWGIPEYNHFGTDEFLRFCRLIGAEPQIAPNLGSGTAEEAADWVRYVNQRWGDRKGGLLWELGNELWGTFQIGYPAPERLAGRTSSFSAAVRGADPRARLIATGADPDHFRDWNATQLRLGPEAFDYLSTHFVVGTANVRKPNASPEFIAAAALALPVGLERRLREMKEQIDADARARGRVKIAFTEWLFHGQDPRSPMFNNMGGALCAAGFLNTLMRVADFTPIADMTGLIEFGGIWQKRGQVYGVPAYWAFRMYSTAEATRLVEARAAGEEYDVEDGVTRIPVIPHVPYLDVTAALNDAGDRLTLFCVNRHLSRDLPAEVRLSGFRPAETGRARQLTAGGIYEINDEVRPEAIVPRERSIPVAGPRFEYTFPRASVTVIELRR